jgi:hypothetical protein
MGINHCNLQVLGLECKGEGMGKPSQHSGDEAVSHKWEKKEKGNESSL